MLTVWGTLEAVWERLWVIRHLARETGPDKLGQASAMMLMEIRETPDSLALLSTVFICDELKTMQPTSFLHFKIKQVFKKNFFF